MRKRMPEGGYLCPSLLPAQSPWIRLVRDTTNPKSPEIGAICQQLQQTPRASVVPMARKWEETTTRSGHAGRCECQQDPSLQQAPTCPGPCQLHNKATLEFYMVTFRDPTYHFMVWLYCITSPS